MKLGRQSATADSIHHLRGAAPVTTHDSRPGRARRAKQHGALSLAGRVQRGKSASRGLAFMHHSTLYSYEDGLVGVEEFGTIGTAFTFSWIECVHMPLRSRQKSQGRSQWSADFRSANIRFPESQETINTTIIMVLSRYTNFSVEDTRGSPLHLQSTIRKWKSVQVHNHVLRYLGTYLS